MYAVAVGGLLSLTLLFFYWRSSIASFSVPCLDLVCSFHIRMAVFAQVIPDPVQPIAQYVICEGPMLGKRLFAPLPAVQQLIVG